MLTLPLCAPLPPPYTSLYSLYNHIRTCAFYLDAAPVLSDLGLPFRAGLDDIISLVPLYGDIVSGILQLYQVFLCWLFGVPAQICGMMVSSVCVSLASWRVIWGAMGGSGHGAGGNGPPELPIRLRRCYPSPKHDLWRVMGGANP